MGDPTPEQIIPHHCSEHPSLDEIKAFLIESLLCKKNEETKNILQVIDMSIQGQTETQFSYYVKNSEKLPSCILYIKKTDQNAKYYLGDDQHAFIYKGNILTINLGIVTWKEVKKNWKIILKSRQSKKSTKIKTCPQGALCPCCKKPSHKLNDNSCNDFFIQTSKEELKKHNLGIGDYCFYNGQRMKVVSRKDAEECGYIKKKNK